MTMLAVLNAAEGMLDLLAGDFDEDSPDCAQQWKAPTRGTEILAPALDGMLRGLGKTPGDVRRWACVRGPGSFTGVRLVLSTVAALRRVTGAEVAGLDYMQALACTGQRMAAPWRGAAPGEVGEPGVVDEADEGRIWVLTHARRDLVHCQPFGFHASGIPVPVEAVDLCSPAEAAERMAASPQGSLMLGSGVARNRDTLAAATAMARPLGIMLPAARDLWLLARQAEYACTDVEPLYVRPCDAVDNLDHIARTQGMEPAAAHARLAELLAAAPEPAAE